MERYTMKIKKIMSIMIMLLAANIQGADAPGNTRKLPANIKIPATYIQDIPDEDVFGSPLGETPFKRRTSAATPLPAGATTPISAEDYVDDYLFGPPLAATPLPAGSATAIGAEDYVPDYDIFGTPLPATPFKRRTSAATPLPAGAATPNPHISSSTGSSMPISTKTETEDEFPNYLFQATPLGVSPSAATPLPAGSTTPNPHMSSSTGSSMPISTKTDSKDEVSGIRAPWLSPHEERRKKQYQLTDAEYQTYLALKDQALSIKHSPQSEGLQTELQKKHPAYDFSKEEQPAIYWNEEEQSFKVLGLEKQRFDCITRAFVRYLKTKGKTWHCTEDECSFIAETWTGLDEHGRQKHDPRKKLKNLQLMQE